MNSAFTKTSDIQPKKGSKAPNPALAERPTAHGGDQKMPVSRTEGIEDPRRKRRSRSCQLFPPTISQSEHRQEEGEAREKGWLAAALEGA